MPSVASRDEVYVTSPNQLTEQIAEPRTVSKIANHLRGGFKSFSGSGSVTFWPTGLHAANLHHSASMKSVPIGFDQALCVGKFYEQPGLFSRYVCDKIEGDAVTWTLLESYQHGELFQATYTQNRQYAVHYVEVADSKIIQHLNALLSEIERRR